VGFDLVIVISMADGRENLNVAILDQAIAGA
jgi:hypothetical protein